MSEPGPLPEQRTQERQKLAAAIEQLARAVDRLARARAAYAQLQQENPDRVTEQAERERAAARERAPRMLVDRLLGGTQTEEGPSVEEAGRARVLLAEEERALRHGQRFRRAFGASPRLAPASRKWQCRPGACPPGRSAKCQQTCGFRGGPGHCCAPG